MVQIPTGSIVQMGQLVEEGSATSNVVDVNMSGGLDSNVVIIPGHGDGAWEACQFPTTDMSVARAFVDFQPVVLLDS
jgi:hypothetical protein